MILRGESGEESLGLRNMKKGKKKGRSNKKKKIQQKTSWWKRKKKLRGASGEKNHAADFTGEKGK